MISEPPLGGFWPFATQNGESHFEVNQVNQLAISNPNFEPSRDPAPDTSSPPFTPDNLHTDNRQSEPNPRFSHPQGYTRSTWSSQNQHSHDINHNKVSLNLLQTNLHTKEHQQIAYQTFIKSQKGSYILIPKSYF